MKRLLSVVLSLCLLVGFGTTIAFASQDDNLRISFRTAVYSVSEEKFKRWTKEQASLDECGEDEYVTLCAEITNTSAVPVNIKRPSISIDGGEKLYWANIVVGANETMSLHVYNVNGKYLTPGLHTASLYASDTLLYSGRFSIGRAWSDIFRFPTQEQIAAYSGGKRSPYLSTWLSAGQDVRYDMYSVDFKSDYIPYGTYSSVFNGYLDFSQLNKQGIVADNNGYISLYAGLQQGAEGSDTNFILSFWDIHCTDAAGNTTVIRPERIYPQQKNDNDTFGNEGEGAHTILPYEWKAGRWYRMVLRCGTSETTGNTTVEQWFQDLKTEEWTHTCTYDTGLKDTCFIGNMALFSENYLSQYAGEVRTLEFTNVRIHTSDGWHDVSSTNYITSNPYSETPGSWDAGTDKNTFYMISTGVPGWGRTEKTGPLTIQNRESGGPGVPSE